MKEFVIGVIPARYGSKRFPGKPIAKIKGKYLVQRVYDQVKKTESIDKIIIATDDSRIYDVVKEFTDDVMFTSVNCASGTDRVAEVVKKIDCEIVVNIQGDEPLISPDVIDKIVDEIKKDNDIVMVTPLTKFKTEDELFSANTSKVVVDKDGFALFFSRSVIPYCDNSKIDYANYYKQIGLYVYRKKFLLRFVELPQSKLEKIEKLEQLRVLENGYKIKTVLVNDDTIPVDVPEDIKKVERLL